MKFLNNRTRRLNTGNFSFEEKLPKNPCVLKKLGKDLESSNKLLNVTKILMFTILVFEYILLNYLLCLLAARLF